MAQIVVNREGSVLFKTEQLPPYACERAFEELKDKFRISIYDIKILKITTYKGYSKLENIKRGDCL